MFIGTDRLVFGLFVVGTFGLILGLTTNVCDANSGAEEVYEDLYNSTEQGILGHAVGKSAYDSNDLEGIWYVHSLASGQGDPWWEHGHLVVNPDCSFSGVINEYKRNPYETLGQFLIAPNGVVTFIGSPKDPDVVVFPHLHMAENKYLVVGVETWSTVSPGTTQITVLTRRGESYQISDLMGTWYVHSLASGPGAPWWEHGPLVVNADGSFSGILQEYKSEPDEISGQFLIDPNGVVTIEGKPKNPYTNGYCILHLTVDKNVIIGIGTWSTASPGTTELKILTRRGTNYTISDMAGRWYVYSLASGPGSPWWLYGPIGIEADGSFSGLVQEYNDDPDEVSGQFQIDMNGVVTIEGKPQDPYANGYGVLHLSADKNVIAGVATWSSGSPGTSDITVFTRIATTD